MHRSLQLAFAAMLAAPLAAQHQFLPVGLPAVSSGYNTFAVDLPFAFEMPGGLATSQLEADLHGRLFVAGASNSGSTILPSYMSNLPSPSINVLWDGISLPAQGGIYVNTGTAGVAVVTWYNVQAGFTTQGCTFQCQLHSDGRIVMVYDSRCPTTPGQIVGVSPGSGITLPPANDFSTAINSMVQSPSPTVFEHFESNPASPFDLGDSALEFAPQGPGGVFGWIVTGSSGTGAIEPVFATTRSQGGSCYLRSTYTYAPSGTGGYDVARGAAAYDANIGSLVGATADDAITATSIDLGFAMPFPDGSSHQFVDVDPNGRILPAGMAGAFGDPSPSLASIYGGGYPAFFGLWTDWDVTQSTSDGIYLNIAPGVAMFTWHRVAQYGSDRPPTCTWQIRLHANGTVDVVHEDLSGLNQIGASADDVAVGMASGAFTFAGEIDHRAIGALPTPVAGPAFEWWDASGASPAEACDLRLTDTPLLTANLPVQGTVWQLQADYDGSATFGLYLFALAPTNTWLELVGSPCMQSVPADVVELRLANGSGTIAPVQLPLPMSTQFNGLELHVQCAVDNAASPEFSGFAGTGFSLAFSNAITGRVAPF